MTRISCLESVALAAKAFLGKREPWGTGAEEAEAERVLDLAVEALDACPQAEPVEGRPLPWKADNYIVRDANGNGFAECPLKADAELIVRISEAKP